ncbi:MAG: type II secretion system protein [Bacteroidales bacterium]
MRAAAGFTLIELLIVVSIITVLAGMSIAQYKHGVRLSQEAVLREDLFRMREAIDQYFADKGQYPPDLQSLVSDGYLRQVPKDPFTKSSDSWVTVPSEADPSNPAAQPGIYDVKSGSEGSGEDGTKYSEW